MPADFSRRDLFAPGAGEIRYISEAEKAFRGREVLRHAGVLPAEISPGEWAFAVFDAAAHGWFSGPDGRRRLMEALAHAWVITSIPALHVRESDWRAAFEEAAPAAGDLDIALPGNVKQIEVFRGCPADRSDGLSWTTDRNTAAWFACRASRVGVIGEVYRAVAPRDAVLVDLRRFSRGESEVLVRPELLRDVSRVDIDLGKALRNWHRKAQRIAAEARAQGLACEVRNLRTSTRAWTTNISPRSQPTRALRGTRPRRGLPTGSIGRLHRRRGSFRWASGWRRNSHSR